MSYLYSSYCPINTKQCKAPAVLAPISNERGLFFTKSPGSRLLCFPVQVFYEFCGTCKNSFFTKYLWPAVSDDEKVNVQIFAKKFSNSSQISWVPT